MSLLFLLVLHLIAQLGFHVGVGARGDIIAGAQTRQLVKEDAGNDAWVPLVINLPLIINTWRGPFQAATAAAYDLYQRSPQSSALDLVEAGCSACEREGCDGTVGAGGSPDESCETTLDAMIMDGQSMKSGAVADLRRIREAISVARAVLEHTTHTLLAGDQATRFAVENGFMEENLSSPASLSSCEAWKRGKCQPNYRINVLPDPTKSCGPYHPVVPTHGHSLDLLSHTVMNRQSSQMAQASHDTISMIVITTDGKMAAGTSTNGAGRKIPGRVGDGPITGSGSYVDSEFGGCGSTGDGDIMMRFLPCYQAVENLRRGMSPSQAAVDVLARIARKFPNFGAGIVVAAKDGQFGCACYGGYCGSFGVSFMQGPNATIPSTQDCPSF